MSTPSWILSGIAAVSLILYFIFTFGKKIRLGQSITSSIPFPIIGILDVMFLLQYIPDSNHIIKLSVIAFAFISVTHVLKSFFDSKKLNIISSILFLISVLAWIFLYRSTFFIYRVPGWINILAACSYFVVFLLLFLIFIKKQSFIFYLFAIISAILISFLHYCAFVSLCFMPETYNIIKFAGITALMAYIIFDLLNNSVIDLKLKNFISFMILFTSYILIALSNLMILY